MPFVIRKYGADDHYEEIERKAGYHSDGIIMILMGFLVVLIGVLSKRPVFSGGGAVLLFIGCILFVRDIVNRVPWRRRE